MRLCFCSQVAHRVVLRVSVPQFRQGRAIMIDDLFLRRIRGR
jgi:hypothetical protein